MNLFRFGFLLAVFAIVAQSANAIPVNSNTEVSSATGIPSTDNGFAQSAPATEEKPKRGFFGWIGRMWKGLTGRTPDKNEKVTDHFEKIEEKKAQNSADEQKTNGQTGKSDFNLDDLDLLDVK